MQNLGGKQSVLWAIGKYSMVCYGIVCSCQLTTTGMYHPLTCITSFRTQLYEAIDQSKLSFSFH